MLQLEAVTHRYRDGNRTITALDMVNLGVSRGALVAVTGPSGNGKTTLAHIAGAVMAPSEGRVVLASRDITRLGTSERARLRRDALGIVYQDDHLDPLLTAAENVALPLRLHGIAARPAITAATAALERCGIEELATRFPSTLSGGQRQRISIARAISGNRVLLVADEPTASLDPATATEVASLFVELAGEGVAVLLTTHDPRIAAFADEILILEGGRRIDLCADETPT